MSRLIRTLQRIAVAAPEFQEVRKALGTLPDRPGVASGRVAAAPPADTGSGIASPLTETERTVTTYDVPVPAGATTLTIEEAETVTFEDANGQVIVLNLTVQNPTPPA